MKIHRMRFVVLSVAAVLAMGSYLSAEADKNVSAAPTKKSPKMIGAGTKPASSPTTTKAAAPCRIAHMKLSGPILQSPPDFAGFGGSSSRLTLREWILRLAEARNDKNVAAVAITIDNASIHWSQAEELSDAIRRLNEVKPVYTFMTSGRLTEYLVGSAARDFTIDPAGEIEIVGIGAELMFFRGTLDWIGVKPQMIQIGKYKGAAEPFENKQPSPELQQEYNSLLDDLYEQLCGQIAANRKLPVEKVKVAVDEGPFRAPEAKKFGLVDGLVEKAKWEEHVSESLAKGKKDFDAEWVYGYGLKDEPALDLSNPFALLKILLKGMPEEEIKSPTIAIIHAEGVITSGHSGESFFSEHMAGAKTLIEDFDTVTNDDRVKAVIFRIDSPGGSALASELIYQAVKRCADKKPVIVSISGMGASGGYYIACGGQTILADSTSIVGSIGVISGKMAITDLLGKLGISTFEFTRGRNAGLEMSRPWTQREAEVMRKMAQDTYDGFIKRVTESRGKKIKDVTLVAQGRIFTAAQASKNGLIDGVGGLKDAVLAAQKAANLKQNYFLILPKPKTLLELLSGDDDESALAPKLPVEMSLVKKLVTGTRGAGYLLNIAQLMGREKTLMAMPYYVSIRN